jgi:hypothetical protein
MRLLNFVLSLFICASASAQEKPAWFDRDTKSKDGWTFFCRADGANEKEALANAQAECSRKMCLLFGVEVEYTQTSSETLKDASTESKIIERCPNVRIVGRADKKKSIECEDAKCAAFLSQSYPMRSYLEEKARLNNPPISSQLIIREGNDTFKDPKACREVLSAFRNESGVGEKHRLARVQYLKKAAADCKEIDYRNVDLQNELSGYLFSNFASRGTMYGSVMTPLISERSKITDRIATLLEIEQIDQSQAPSKIKKLISENYDHLYFRTDHYSYYTDELKTCSTLSKITRAWPKAYLDPVTVCVQDEGPSDKECKDASYLMVRAQYIGCVCNLGAPRQSQRCFEVLNQHFNDTCPLEMTESCFRKASKQVSEEMNFKMDVLKETK